MIGAASATGFEACVAQRPLVEFNLTGHGEVAEYAAAGSALAAATPLALRQALERLRDDPAAVQGLRAAQARFADRYGGR